MIKFGYPINRGENKLNKKNNLFKLELLILSVLFKKDCYGYEICTFIKEQSNGLFDIKEGVIYPILYNLTISNYVSCYEETVKRRVRVFYRIEDKGKIYLQELNEEFQNKLDFIQNLIPREELK